MEALTRIALACTVALTASVQAQTPSQYELMGVPAQGKTGPEVRLLWTVSQGWLPAGGFHVYRTTEGQAPQRLTTQPIKLNTERLSPEAALVVNGTPMGIAGKPLFSGELTSRGSSKTVFQSFKSELTRLRTMPGVSAAQLAAQAAQKPEVKSFRESLAPSARPAKGTAPSDADKTASARLQVLLTGLSSYSAAQQLGLAFVDKAPPSATGTYRYSLRAVDANGQELAGEAAFVLVRLGVAGSEAPPVPAELDSAQLSQSTVALHWEPLTQAEEQSLVGASYSVYRNGQKLNKEPLRLAFQATKTGSHVPALTSFHDERAPLGSVTYTVKLTDAFGRESAPASTTLTVSDLRAPAAVPQAVVVASRSTPGAVRVYWATPSAALGDIPTQDAAFDLYRTDSPQTEILLTSGAPIPGDDLGSLRTVGGSTIVSETLADLTLGNLVALKPALRGTLKAAGLKLEDYRAETLDKLVTHLPANLKLTLGQQLSDLRCYTDSTVTPDKDYRYRVSACYTTSRDRHTAGGLAGTVAVPTTAAPAPPTGLSASFTRGAGTFGYLETGASTTTLRNNSLEGVAVEQARKIVAAKPIGPSFKQTGNVPTLTATPPKAPSMSIAGTVQLTWQPVSFSSPVRYRIYRAVATGLFPTIAGASLGQPPLPQLKQGGKLGAVQRTTMQATAKARVKLALKFFENYPSVPRENYVLLTETTQTRYTDTLPVSQRMHYHYRVVPVSRWGVEGPESPLTDTEIPATLPPSTPTLLKALVDEATSEGHVQLVFTPNPTTEHVTKYLVFRKPMADVLQSAQRDSTRLRVASTQVVGAPKVATPLAQSKLRNLGLTDIKANGGAILKRLLDSSGYLPVGALPAPSSSAPLPASLTFVDTTGQPRVPYAYRIVAQNSDQLGSAPSAPLDATALKVKCEAPQSFTTSLTTGEAPTVELTWQGSSKEIPAKYVLERAQEKLAPPAASRIDQLKQSGKLPQLTYVTLGTFEPATLRFTDASVRSGRRYTYRLRAVDSEGLFSDALSKSIVVPALAAARFGDPTPGNPPPPPTDPTPPAPPAPLAGEPLAPSKSAQLGKLYRYNNENLWAFALLKAEYTTQPFVWGPKDDARLFYPTPEQKFIKLTLSVKNISKDEQEFGYQSLIGYALSADGNRGPEFQNFKRTDNGNHSAQRMPPGKTTVVEAIATVSAAGAAQELVIGETRFVLGKENAVASLPAVLSKDGVTVLPEVPAVKNQAYPGARFEASFLSLTRSAVTFGEQALEDGKEFVLVTVKLRNLALEESKVEYQTFTLTLYDTDDDKYTADKPYKENKPEQVTAPLSPTQTEGDTRTVRYLFTVPKGASFKRMTLRESDARTYVYPQGEIK